ncbi:DNA pilot protein [Microvirus D_HF4_162]|nr:DNA pilot protein [Microvirus D_HF4_162]
MDPMTAIAGINAGLSLFNSGANRMAQERQNQQNMMAQRIENHLNRKFQLDMWNKNNEYNLPVNQMSRLRDAGINPHLAYSNGTPMNVSNAPASSSASAAAQGVAPRYENVNLGELAQLALVKSQIDESESRTELNKANAEKTGHESDILSQQSQNMSTQIAQENAQRQLNLGLTEKNIEESSKRIDKLISENDKVIQEIENLKSEKKLTDAQVLSVIAGIKLTYANIRHINEKIKTEKYVRADLEASARQKNEIAKGQNNANYIAEKFGLSIAENEYKFSETKYKEANHRMFLMMKNAGLIDKTIEEKDWNMILNAIDSSVNAVSKLGGLILD